MDKHDTMSFALISLFMASAVAIAVTRPPTVQEIPGSIPGRSGRLSEFRCDLIKRSDNTWNPVRKLQETMWAALGKPLMSNYPLRKAMANHRTTSMPSGSVTLRCHRQDLPSGSALTTTFSCCPHTFEQICILC